MKDDIYENASKQHLQSKIDSNLAMQQKLRENGDPKRLALDVRLEEIRRQRIER